MKPMDTKCKLHYGQIDLDTLLPITDKGEFREFGYRLCGNMDCVNPEHITTSIRKARAKGLRPKPLFHKRHDITFEELRKYAKPIERGSVKPEKCAVPMCGNQHRAMNLCNGHHLKFTRWRKERGFSTKRMGVDYTSAVMAAQPYVGVNNFRPKDRYCHVEGCSNEYEARGLCKKHHTRFLRATKGKING